MTKAEYLEFHKTCCEKMVSITQQKNADYTGGSHDPFANFSEVEVTGICATEIGFLVRMTDKLARIRSYVKQGTLAVKEESVTDTLLDLANYCVLFAGYLRSRQMAPAEPVSPSASTHELGGETTALSSDGQP